MTDFVVDAVDMWIESDSRAQFGGLPRVEYLIHGAGLAMMGAITAMFVVTGWPNRLLGSALMSHDLPGWLQIEGWVVVTGAVSVGTLELCLMLMAYRTGRTAR